METQDCSLYGLKQQIVSMGKLMLKKGLVTGTGGNISARVPGENSFLITPSGMDYQLMTAEDLVTLDLSTCKIVAGQRRPSVERHLHQRVLLAFPQVQAVIHTHSVYAAAVAITRKNLPAVTDNMVVAFGGEVKTAGYAPIGTDRLALNAVEAMDRASKGQFPPVALLANHGSVAGGKNLKDAFNLIEMLEESAKAYVHSFQIGGPVILTSAEIEQEIDLLAGRYGQLDKVKTASDEV